LSGLSYCVVTAWILTPFLRRSRLLMATFSALLWSSFSPWSRRGTVAGGDRVVEERRIEREF
jgi:hypothetical protein